MSIKPHVHDWKFPRFESSFQACGCGAQREVVDPGESKVPVSRAWLERVLRERYTFRGMLDPSQVEVAVQDQIRSLIGESEA